MKKITVWFVIVVLAVLMGVLVGGGFYMLDVSL
jgi:hypothetical protein